MAASKKSRPKARKRTNSAILAGLERSPKWYGWKRDTPDQRDHMMQVRAPVPVPPSLDLRADDFGIYDQGNLGSCTANGSLGAYRDLLHAESLPDFVPSRLAEYYWSRQLEHDTAADGGAEIRDAVKVLATIGAAPESDWPYIVSKFASPPPAKAKTDAKQHVALEYVSVPCDVRSMQTALVQNKNLIIGISAYESFESAAVAKTGIVPMPAMKEKLVGGHCMRCRGYKTIKGKLYFIIANSWGTSWGDSGYCYMPAAYLTNVKLASDFWSLQRCE